jgi:hypothetical protein
MKSFSAAMNASDVRVDTNSKCIALVAMQIKILYNSCGFASGIATRYLKWTHIIYPSI